MKISRFENFMTEDESKGYTVDSAPSAPEGDKKSLWGVDEVQYGTGKAVASIQYKYIPEELSSTGNPLFCGWDMIFDGGERAGRIFGSLHNPNGLTEVIHDAFEYVRLPYSSKHCCYGSFFLITKCSPHLR